MQNGYQTRTKGGSQNIPDTKQRLFILCSDSFGLRDWIPITKKPDSSPYTALGGVFDAVEVAGSGVLVAMEISGQ